MKRTRKMVMGLVVLGLLVSLTGMAQAALIAYEGFDYAAGQNLTLETTNGGTGWTSAWATTGVPGLTTSGSGKSLYFDQSPDLIVDGSTHVWSESSKANERDFSTAVDIVPDTLYYTVLVRAYGGGASTADFRTEFNTGIGASGNMRGNVGISNGTLFADGISTGYLPTGSATAAGAFADDTTYLLAMKRTGSAIFASLITADGNASTLAAEPVWQVSDAVATGVAFQSIRFMTNGGGGGAGIRVDELRIATDWDSAVAGMVVPEPATMLLLGLGSLVTLRRKK